MTTDPVYIEVTYGGVAGTNGSNGAKGDKGDTGANGSLAWKGDWASDHGTYYVNEFVYHAVSGYGKGLFRCIAEHDPAVAATEPVVGGSAATYWETSIGGGENGAGTGDLKADGTVPLSANWDAGSHKVTAETLESDVATGTAPLVIASTTKVANLNVSALNGKADTAFVEHSLATAANDMLAASGSGAFVKKTRAEIMTMLGIDKMTINFGIDGGAAAITTGVKAPGINIPVACTITSVEAVSEDATSGSIVVDIWKDTYANSPPTDADTITASAPVTISSSTKSQDTTLTGWTKSLAAGDRLVFNVDSCTSIKRCSITLKADRA